MNITLSKNGACRIKTKKSDIEFGKNIVVNDKVLPGPGEYEVGDAFFEIGSNVSHFHSEGLILAFIEKSKKALKEKDLEKLENVEIVLAEVANSNEDFARVSDFISEVDPSLVVIIGIEDENIIKDIEGSKPEEVESLSVTKTDLPVEGRKVYWLKQK